METILITAYAVNPYKGSEEGTGWNWICALARHKRIIAITRENNLAAIENYLQEHPLPQAQNLQFVGYDLPRRWRFWKRGTVGALAYFFLWQRGLPNFIRRQGLVFDLAHHLNFHNDWLPPFLWKLKRPLVWGPMGHHPRVPKAYLLPFSGWRSYTKDRMRWAIKQVFWRLYPGLKRSLQETALTLPMHTQVAEVLPLAPANSYLISQVGARARAVRPMRNPDRFEILSVGRFIPLKGFDLTIEAFAKLLQMLPPKWRPKVGLTLVGRGPQEAALRALARRRGISRRVRFRDWMPQSDLWQEYQCADVFLFPSHEGAGMVVAEALSAGLPVICLDNVGPGALINESCGLRVPYSSYAQTIEGLARHLQCLMTDPALRSRLSSGARAHFEARYEWSAKARQVNALYDQVLAAPTPETPNL